VDSARHNSATYDEPTYLRVAARWWRTGDQEEITRMGSPLLFWKLQQVPVSLWLDRSGSSELLDDPIARVRDVLPSVRIASLWIWLAGLLITSWWSLRLYGPRAMAFAAWLFVLSPNLLANGTLATMEMPITASTIGLFALFWKYLETGRRRWFWASAAACGLAWACKFTAILFPPILALTWWLREWRGGASGRSWARLALHALIGLTGFIVVAGLADFAINGFATIPLSPSREAHPSLLRWFGPIWGRRLAILYETTLPQDWVGFVIQTMHQAGGGPSYLFGETRMKGWWYYYFIALAVKVPLSFLVLVIVRTLTVRRVESDNARAFRNETLIPIALVSFLAITAAASTRNYGIRYLLPLAPLAIVWISALAEVPRWNWLWVAVGVVGSGVATARVHPYELTYFNVLGGGPIGGRKILSDSNLDWGQGLIALARLQRDEPAFRDLTLYHFGDVEAIAYGVAGDCHVVSTVGDHAELPPLESLRTRYLGVSASLQWGPWGPPGFFDRLRGVAPVRLTDDATIAIYKTSDILPPVERSVEITPPGEAIFKAVGHRGDVVDNALGVDRVDRHNRKVLDHDEVFLPSKDPDRESAADDPGIQLEEDSAVTLIGGSADRDEPENRTSLGVDTSGSGVNRLLAVKSSRNDHSPPPAARGDLEPGPCDEIADQSADVGVGGFGSLVGVDRIGGGPGIGQARAEWKPALHTEPARHRISQRAAGTDDQDRTGYRHRPVNLPT
jgi:4-amino-4-deoxy-L-arabinose transferase-like glycosyltransferase